MFVQDSINLKKEADAKIPPALKSRVFFQPHSFFEPQSRLAGMADVLLLRHILHDWDDNDCLVILRHLAAVLQPGASIIVAEQVLGQSGTYDWQTERVMRALDMQVMTPFGSKERTFDDWDTLFPGGRSDIASGRNGSACGKCGHTDGVEESCLIRFILRICLVTSMLFIPFRRKTVSLENSDLLSIPTSN